LPRFAGGIHLDYYKEFSAQESISKVPISKRLIIPLSQHIGVPCEPEVSPGEQVAEGQLIGRAKGRVSANIHAPVSGTVKRLERSPHPLGSKALAVILESDGEPRSNYLSPLEGDVETLDSDSLRERVAEAGIVGLGGAAFPAHIKYSPPKTKAIDTLIINGCECEPYLTADFRIMVERTADVILGVRLISRILGSPRILIAVENDKAEAIARLSQEGEGRAECVVLPTRYPQGAEKVLIKAVLDREVPQRGLPLDVGVVVANAGTALAVAEAVRDGKPLIERVVTVTGNAVKRPGNFLARIGTPLSVLIEAAGGFTRQPGKIVMGGPMMGVAQYSTETPLIKSTSGILVLSQKETVEQVYLPCIRCSFCVKACPVRLLPSTLSLIGEHRRWEMAREYGVFDCIECGCCSYVCPAKRPIVQWIRETKAHLRVKGGSRRTVIP
jgi:electron transport complex protein RnfC